MDKVKGHQVLSLENREKKKCKQMCDWILAAIMYPETFISRKTSVYICQPLGCDSKQQTDTDVTH